MQSARDRLMGGRIRGREDLFFDRYSKHCIVRGVRGRQAPCGADEKVKPCRGHGTPGSCNGTNSRTIKPAAKKAHTECLSRGGVRLSLLPEGRPMFSSMSLKRQIQKSF